MRWVSAALAALAIGMVLPLSAQVQPRPARPWTLPRTPWGDPDLQDNYTNK
jgi:hypothetical protein